MKLIKYLNDNYYTKQELLSESKLEESELSDFQKQRVMPYCSYKINLQLSCDSFFGIHQEKSEIEYYPKGYTFWIGIIQTVKHSDDVYSFFSQRYRDTIKKLNTQGLHSSDPMMNSKLSENIENEWKTFLKGVYGLCTRTGLPEDIASKELAIFVIKELSEKVSLSKIEMEKLAGAINILDSSSSMFAPHERLRSSRHRIINENRRKYQLIGQSFIHPL